MSDHREDVDYGGDHHVPESLNLGWVRHHHRHFHTHPGTAEEPLTHSHWHAHGPFVVERDALESAHAGIAREGENLPADDSPPTMTLPRDVVALLQSWAETGCFDRGGKEEDRLVIERVGEILRDST